MKPFLANERSRCAPQVRITGSISARSGARPGEAAGFGLGCCRSIVSSSSATGWPIAAQSGASSSRARISASRSRCSRGSSRNSGKPGPPQQRPQRRIAQRGPVEFAEMRVAAGVVQQQGIADIVKRRAVLPGRQRAVGGTGELLKSHEISFRAQLIARSPGSAGVATAAAADLPKTCKSLKNYTKAREIQM